MEISGTGESPQKRAEIVVVDCSVSELVNRPENGEGAVIKLTDQLLLLRFNFLEVLDFPKF
jgi:hypothetical protein